MFALALAAGARADAITQGQEITAQALKAYDSGNFSSAADLFGQALALRPNHPSLTLRFAGACVRAGRTDDALHALADYAALGLNASLSGKEWLSVVTHPQFAPVALRFAENAEPKGSLALAARIDEPQILAEGLALDRASKRMFIGSVHKRKVLALSGGAVSEFVPATRDGLFGAFGLNIDSARGSLFVASSALPQMAGFTSADKDKTGVFEFALADGRLKRKALVPADGKEHAIGDLVVTQSGDVFASDSASPVIYRLRVGSAALEEFARSDTFHSLQGLAVSADSKKLAVADYSAGIHVVDIASKAPATLAMPPHTTLHGIDALLRHGPDLIGVQNGINPQRVVRLRMNETWSAVEGVDVLAANLAEMDEPTLAVLDHGELLVIGNGQWSRFADDGTIKGDAPFAPTRVLRLKLPPAQP